MYTTQIDSPKDGTLAADSLDQSLCASSEKRLTRETRKTDETFQALMRQVEEEVSDLTLENKRLHKRLTESLQQNHEAKSLSQSALAPLKEEAQSLYKSNLEMANEAKEFVRKGEERIAKTIAERRTPSEIAARENYVQKCQVLEEALLGISTPWSQTNGVLLDDFSSRTISEVLSTKPYENLLGYLAKYVESVLKVSLGSEDLPNLSLFSSLLDKYFSIIENDPNRFPEGAQVGEVAALCDLVIGFIYFVPTSKDLFEKILRDYKASLSRICDLYNQALAKRSQELCQSVYNKVDRLYIEKIRKFAFKTENLRAKSASLQGQCLHNYVMNTRNPAGDFGGLMRPSDPVFMECVLPFLSLDSDHIRARSPDSCRISLADSKLAKEITFYRECLLEWALPHPVQSNTICSVFPPYDLRGRPGMGEQYVRRLPNEAIIAERLGLGLVEFEYSTTSNETISLFIKFRENNGTYHSLGTGYFRLLSDIPSANPGDIFDSARTSVAHFFNWSNVENWSPVPESKEILSNLINQQVVKLRREALSSLASPSKENNRYQKALDELDTSYSLLKAFGMNPETLSKLFNREDFENHLHHYLNGDVSKDTPFIPISKNEFHTISDAFLSQMKNHQSGNNFLVSYLPKLLEIRRFLKHG